MRRPGGWIAMAIVLGLICAVTAGVATARAAPSASAWSAGINAGLLAATLAAILWYSWESHAMREVMVRQTETAIRPLLVTTIEQRPSSPGDRWEDMLVIRNIGKAPALFVRLEDITLHHDPETPEGRLSVGFEVVDVIEPGPGEVARSRIHIGTEVTVTRDWTFVASLNPRYANETYEVTIHYEDINRQQHWSLMQMGKGGICLHAHA